MVTIQTETISQVWNPQQLICYTYAQGSFHQIVWPGTIFQVYAWPETISQVYAQQAINLQHIRTIRLLHVNFSAHWSESHNAMHR